MRDYGFDYGEVRRHAGIAFYPYVEDGALKWRRNPAYKGGELIIKDARTWEDFSLEAGVPVYTQFQKDKDRFLFVADRALSGTVGGLCAVINSPRTIIKGDLTGCWKNTVYRTMQLSRLRRSPQRPKRRRSTRPRESSQRCLICCII